MAALPRLSPPSSRNLCENRREELVRGSRGLGTRGLFTGDSRLNVREVAGDCDERRGSDRDDPRWKIDPLKGFSHDIATGFLCWIVFLVWTLGRRTNWT